MNIHVVQRGDTLWSIARQYGVAVSEILIANQLQNPNQLLIGQSLVIPPPYLQHTVQRGETVQEIASRYGVTADEIVRANLLQDPTLIYPGQNLSIPVIVHTVAPGETLAQIARRYGTTPAAIASANRISNVALIYAGQQLRIPEPAKPTIDVNAFTANYGTAAGQSVEEVADYLTYVSPFAYRIQADGSLQSIDDTAILDAAKRNNVIPMMAITNFSSTETGTSLAHTILSNTTLQDTLLGNVRSTMRQKGYRGLNIDFENVSPDDKDNYNQFIQRAVDSLHPEGYFVSSSLAPKTSANQKGLLYEAHDYAAHGRILDFVVLMTYEWGYRLGPPQAISPIDQIRRVLDYAVTVIPRNKIFMGFQLYARDWVLPHVQGQQAETFDMQEAMRRALRYGVNIQYDATAQSPYFQYTDSQGTRHEVWFEDARSAQVKLDTVKQYNLRGISYWVLGYPFPANWALLDENFNIRRG